MIYGRETVDSRHIVLLGIVFDTFAFALFMMNSKRAGASVKNVKRLYAEKGLKNIIGKYKNIFVCSVFGGILVLLLPTVFTYFVLFGGDLYAKEFVYLSLMFIQLTNVFNQMYGGRIIGIIFFVLVLFAAVTSSISLVESIVAVLCEDGRMKRLTACLIVFGAILVLGTLSSLGNGALSGVEIFGLSILDAFDFLANNILMPIVAIITCVIAGWFIDKTILPKEIGIDKNKKLTTYFNVIIRYVAPICILVILVTGLFITL
jgi:NSS family neurotransmitter:Na+ symporter